MPATLTALRARAVGQLRREDAAVWRQTSVRGSETTQPRRLFAIAFLANTLDLLLSWGAVMHYGLSVEANPFPLMAWGWAHGLIGAMAVKAALLAIVVAAAAMQPRYARPLLGLVAVAGILGAGSAVAVL